MPQRSNRFQRLIYLINAGLAAGSRVTESAMVMDKSNGMLREVDILIEAQVGAHKVTVGIEVIERTRVADSTWVEGMCGKHRCLPTDKLVLVSASGFTRPALDKAKHENVEALTVVMPSTSIGVATRS